MPYKDGHAHVVKTCFVYHQNVHDFPMPAGDRVCENRPIAQAEKCFNP